MRKTLVTLKTDSEFHIRSYMKNDEKAIRELVFSILREYQLTPDAKGKDKDLMNISESYLHKNGYFGVLLNSLQNEIIGCFGLFPLDDHICELRKMYLKKKFRGRGLGEMMLTHALKVAKEKGYRKIVLETITPLKEAIGLYKKHGFKEKSPDEINNRVDQAFEMNI